MNPSLYFRNGAKRHIRKEREVRLELDALEEEIQYQKLLLEAEPPPLPTAKPPPLPKEEPEPEPEPEEKEKGEPSPTGGAIIGYWMIPHGDSFLKLKIYERYSSKVPRKLVSILNRREPVPHVVEDHLVPVFPILVHLKTLSRYFNWIEPNPGIREALFDPTNEFHSQARRSYQRLLMSHGWSFFILEGENGYLGSEESFPPYFTQFLDELRGNSTNSPRNVRVDASGMKRMYLLTPGGSRIEMLSVKELNARFPDTPHAEPAKYQSDILNDLTNGRMGFDDYTEDQLRWAFDPEDFAKYYDRMDRDEYKDQLRQTLQAYLAYAQKQGYEVEDYDLDHPAFKGLGAVNEVTFRKLYRATARNGQYAIGGMRRVNGVWVIDPSVTGRMDNARFVITRAPRIYLGEDGLFQIRYIFRSRNDRSTTGVSQSGYVKFLPPSKGLLKKILRWAKRLFVAETAWDSDVHTFCTCPDFKYRWHWVLANAGASHIPSGAGGEAINQPPDQTNPNRKLCLCKHLVACGPFIQNTPKEFKDRVNQMVKNQTQEPPLRPMGPNVEPEVAPGAELGDVEEFEQNVTTTS